MDIVFEAPPAPKRGARSLVFIGLFVVILAWSFQGAKLRPGELIQGIPQIAVTVGRMLPPDFSKITDAKSYFLPENLSLRELLLPLPLAEAQERIKQRWWNNTFPQTVVGATGAGYAQILSFAVLPQILPDLISFTLYRFETNIRAASVLGLIGAGGIGYLMSTSFRTFQYQEAAAIVVILIALVMLVDYLSSRLRNLAV